MKIKTFKEGYGEESFEKLEEKVNEFIKDKKVIDIKCSSYIEPIYNQTRVAFLFLVCYE